MNDADRQTGRVGAGLSGFRIPSVWLVAGGGWIGRGIQVIAQLVAVRILMGSLGTSGYGVFAVLASLNGWLLLSDFSIGISLQNYISERRAKGEETDDLILTGALLSLGTACFTGLVMLSLGPWLSSLLLGGFTFLSASDRTLAFYAMALPSIGTALGGVVYRIWFARHRGYLSNLVPAAGTVIGTAAIWLLQHISTGPRIALSTLLYYLPLAVLPMIALGFTAARATRHHGFSQTLAKPLLQRSFRFWISGLLAASVLQVDYIIMVRVLAVQDIVIYSVATKLFLLIFFVYTALLQALWPICSEAIARNDWHSVFAKTKNYIIFGMMFTLLAGVGVALTNTLIVRIIAPGLRTPIPLVVIGLLTLYVMVRVWTDTFAMVLQSMNDLLLLWIVAPVQSLLSISLQFLGARYFGLPGMICGLIGCFLLTAAWVLPVRCWLHARRYSVLA
ncbi:O-antigen/teichoic acid export membrane protein [Sphingomonas sp. BK036]|uniref:MATE family efflux transporter n=1 Tax=Sphingomonas sp. BK036 TaxID=2512122 RepID=UPI0010299CE3|nr:MATE family efflux transporter [Sphingomonas sp. BK036]RZT44860.1 O-antigen/teichoic acid export membrane protein [Sphingomonas sp. BK036]